MVRICRLVTAGALCALAGCASGSDDGDAGYGFLDDVDVACTDLVGMPTEEVADTGPCLDPEGTITFLGFGITDCVDGTQLVYSDYGWGFTGEDFQAHERADGQQVPPDEAQESCEPGE